MTTRRIKQKESVIRSTYILGADLLSKEDANHDMRATQLKTRKCVNFVNQLHYLSKRKQICNGRYVAIVLNNPYIINNYAQFLLMTIKAGNNMGTLNFSFP